MAIEAQVIQPTDIQRWAADVLPGAGLVAALEGVVGFVGQGPQLTTTPEALPAGLAELFQPEAELSLIIFHVPGETKKGVTEGDSNWILVSQEGEISAGFVVLPGGKDGKVFFSGGVEEQEVEYQSYQSEPDTDGNQVAEPGRKPISKAGLLQRVDRARKFFSQNPAETRAAARGLVDVAVELLKPAKTSAEPVASEPVVDEAPVVLELNAGPGQDDGDLPVTAEATTGDLVTEPVGLSVEVEEKALPPEPLSEAELLARLDAAVEAWTAPEGAATEADASQALGLLSAFHSLTERLAQTGLSDSLDLPSDEEIPQTHVVSIQGQAGRPVVVHALYQDTETGSRIRRRLEIELSAGDTGVYSGTVDLQATTGEEEDQWINFSGPEEWQTVVDATVHVSETARVLSAILHRNSGDQTSDEVVEETLVEPGDDTDGFPDRLDFGGPTLLTVEDLETIAGGNPVKDGADMIGGEEVVVEETLVELGNEDGLERLATLFSLDVTSADRLLDEDEAVTEGPVAKPVVVERGDEEDPEDADEPEPKQRPFIPGADYRGIVARAFDKLQRERADDAAAESPSPSAPDAE